MLSSPMRLFGWRRWNAWVAAAEMQRSSEIGKRMKDTRALFGPSAAKRNEGNEGNEGNERDHERGSRENAQYPWTEG